MQAASTNNDFIRFFNVLLLFIFQGVGWSIPVLEKILSAVKKHLAIDNCCDQLRAILELKRLLHLRNIEEGKEIFPEVRSVFCTARQRKKRTKKVMHVQSFYFTLFILWPFWRSCRPDLHVLRRFSWGNLFLLRVQSILATLATKKIFCET